MCYSVQLKYQIFVKGYGSLSFAENIIKNVRGKFSLKLLDHTR